ncbi:hypothetical protein X739_10875 [Mesorhizobium sp. LNHC220B00]|nr:hypothetical protein X739_10875 [Mesorhizobium sp. LNHC220B00]ESY99035.1 hypothetical protein X738_14950 [Mesorhizobium sp. LNHC209A00]
MRAVYLAGNETSKRAKERSLMDVRVAGLVQQKSGRERIRHRVSRITPDRQ